jgi:hypothetical protein
MRDEEQKAAGESRYDHRLNAFLSAARSVDYRLRCECPNTYPDWRKQWNAEHPAEDSVLVFINSKRANDAHKRGSGRTAKTEEIKVGTGSSYSDKGGKVESPENMKQLYAISAWPSGPPWRCRCARAWRPRTREAR